MMPPEAMRCRVWMQGMDMMAAAPPGVMDAANPGMDDGGMGAMDAAFGDLDGDGWLHRRHREWRVIQCLD